jgi:hypothetical protein
LGFAITKSSQSPSSSSCARLLVALLGRLVGGLVRRFVGRFVGALVRALLLALLLRRRIRGRVVAAALRLLLERVAPRLARVLEHPRRRLAIEGAAHVLDALADRRHERRLHLRDEPARVEARAIVLARQRLEDAIQLLERGRVRLRVREGREPRQLRERPRARRAARARGGRGCRQLTGGERGHRRGRSERDEQHREGERAGRDRGAHGSFEIRAAILAAGSFVRPNGRAKDRLPQSTIRKSLNSPVKLRQRTSTRSTRAALGPRFAQPMTSFRQSSSPSARISTNPSGLFLTHPVRPSRRASRCVDARK